jgi:hypothetical protein
LVTQEGEEILATYDNWAINELRRLELVWSGWGNKTSLPSEDWKGTFPRGYGLREVRCSNPNKLRLFFLSLLWRAAATDLPEFHAIGVNVDELERLRIMVTTANPYPLDFFPIRLLQVITKGFDHNLSPVSLDWGHAHVGSEQIRMRLFRFYFDGLITHFHRDDGNKMMEIMPAHLIGFSSDLRVQTQTFEDSFQFKNMMQHVAEGTQQWSSEIERMIGKMPDHTS